MYHTESAKKLVEEYKTLPPDDDNAVYNLESRWEEWKGRRVEVSSCMIIIVSQPLNTVV